MCASETTSATATGLTVAEAAAARPLANGLTLGGAERPSSNAKTAQHAQTASMFVCVCVHLSVHV